MSLRSTPYRQRHRAACQAVEIVLGGRGGGGFCGDPRLFEVLAQLAANFDQERARTHGGVADFQVQDLVRAHLGPQAFEDRRQGGAHDRFRQ
jgi:hypothetical protein